MSEFAGDPRYGLCSEQGRGELAVYLQWIMDSNLEDTEYAYVSYLLGRTQITDPRHLFAIWEHQMGGKIDRTGRSQMRRFFMNPSPQVAFNAPSSAGWFDYVPSVYQFINSVPAPYVNPPTFAKVGSSDLPADSMSKLTHIVVEKNVAVEKYAENFKRKCIHPNCDAVFESEIPNYCYKCGKSQSLNSA